MADISTWEDFVSKYTDSSVSEINITSDLTVPAEGITSDIRVDGEKTINGGNHFIYNIAGTADHIFNTENHTGGSNFNVTWNNTQFQNIYGSNVFYAPSSSRKYTFKNCVFQGQGSNLFTGLCNAKVENSALTWTTTATSGDGVGSVDLDYSWIWMKDWVITSGSSTIFANLNNCYIKGDIRASSDSVTTISKLASKVEYCVINFSSSLTLTSVATTRDNISVLNKDKLPKYKQNTDPESGIAKVTDSQMKNAAELYALGFPIVVL